ncbi:MAG: TonB-dependent receptor [Mangrovibacterium sp.]
MKAFLKKTFLAFVISFAALGTWAQGTITGRVIDAATKVGMIGATVTETATTNGAIVDATGKFTLKLEKGTSEIQVSFLGYTTIRKAVAVEAGKTIDLGTILLNPSAESLDELVVVGTGVLDVAKDRETPVAMSTIKVTEIQTKAGNQEFPDVMKNTPSVYVASQAGGFGDSKLLVRGFDQNNLALLFNGQPVNGMEDGNVYWSNWQGLTDIASVVQIQRGLGSSKLAISSVGATVNIVTKATDLTANGRASVMFGNDAFMKYTASYSTGLNDKGWGVSMLLSHWQGDGYNDGTQGKGQTYFLSVGYKPSEKHAFNLSVTGAPQWHNQNSTQKLSAYDRDGNGDISNKEQRYNTNWGYLNGEVYTWKKNFYHKPVLNLNWDWNINSKSTLSTVAYASTGSGGGTGSYGNSKNAYIYGADGQIDFDGIVANNKAIDNSSDDYAIGGKIIGNYSKSAIRRSSMNMHRWMGIVTNFNREINEHFSYNLGADLRTYFGEHYRLVEDLMGLDGYYDDMYGNPGWAQNYPDGVVYTNEYESSPYGFFKDRNSVVNQKLDYVNNERISYAGAFGQLEYKNEYLSAFVQGAISRQSFQRFDYVMYSDPDDQSSEKLHHNGYNLKAGGNYNINEQHNVFMNTGYYSRQPFFDNMFLNYMNEVNPDVANEGIFGLEVGYGFRSRYFDADVNAYYTKWTDRQIRETGDYDSDGVTDDVALFQNVAELHTGIELEFVARPISKVDVKGFLSAGNWEYADNSIARVFDEDRNILANQTLYLDGVKVGNAAQFTFGLGANWNIVENLFLDADYRQYNKLYASIDPSSFTTDSHDGSLELPNYGLLDMGLSYRFVLNNNDSFKLRFNINNVLNKQYISQSDTNIHAAEGDKTWEGVNVANKVYFGNGTTWNFGVTYNF